MYRTEQTSLLSGSHDLREEILMNKLRRASILLVVLLVTTMIVSCSKSKTIKLDTTPEEATKMYLDRVFKNDKSIKDELGYNDAEYIELFMQLDKQLVNKLSKIKVEEFAVTRQVRYRVRSEFFTGLSKLQYEILPVYLKKDTAKVEVKINAFDFNKIKEDSLSKIEKERSESISMTNKEYANLLFKAIGANFEKGISSEVSTSVEVYLTLEDGIWVPLNRDLMNVMKVVLPV